MKSNSTRLRLVEMRSAIGNQVAHLRNPSPSGILGAAANAEAIFQAARLAEQLGQIMSGVVAMCGACLTWIEPRGDRCHHCGELFSLYGDDPLENDVAERLGEPLTDLGPVVLNRPRLPVAGRLYGTTTGWVFRPTFTIDESGALTQFPIPRRDRSWLWRFVPSSAASRKARADLAVRIDEPPVDSEECSFAELYRAAPGGLFVPLAWMQKIRRQRSVLRIWYHQVQRVEFELLASEGVIDDALNKLDEHEVWTAILS